MVSFYPDRWTGTLGKGILSNIGSACHKKKKKTWQSVPGPSSYPHLLFYTLFLSYLFLWSTMILLHLHSPPHSWHNWIIFSTFNNWLKYTLLNSHILVLALSTLFMSFKLDICFRNYSLYHCSLRCFFLLLLALIYFFLTPFPSSSLPSFFILLPFLLLPPFLLLLTSFLPPIPFFPVNCDHLPVQKMGKTDMCLTSSWVLMWSANKSPLFLDYAW